MTVLPDVGSELPLDSNGAAVVCSAPVNEAVDDALDVVNLRVGKWWFRTDSEVVLPLIGNKLSVISDLVYMKTDVCGDDRFSPGVKDYTSLESRTVCDSLRVMMFSQTYFRDVGQNWTMGFSDRWMCFRAVLTDSSLCLTVQTLTFPREALPGVVGFMSTGGGISRGSCMADSAGEESPGVDDCSYIRQADGEEPPFCVRLVTGSHRFSSPLGRGLGLWQPPLPFGFLSGTTLGDIRFAGVLVWRDRMSSGVDLPVVKEARAAAVATRPLPGTFLGFGLDLRSDKLYDLGGALPDVMGLRAAQPSAAIVKVMSVPDSRCVRIIMPDDHLPNGFHEILIHDMEDEETLLVVLNELGCLRLDWPNALFMFMARYQFELDQMRKECQERFGSHSLEFVRPVANTFNRIWVSMWPG